MTGLALNLSHCHMLRVIEINMIRQVMNFHPLNRAIVFIGSIDFLNFAVPASVSPC